MLLEDFNYNLPAERIAQTPLEQRDASKMLVLHKASGEIEHRYFTDILNYIQPNDCLVFNQSKVINARLLGHRATGAKVEVFLLKALDQNRFECLVKSNARKAGLSFNIQKQLQVTIEASSAVEGIFIAQLESLVENKTVEQLIRDLGHVPLPPYIKRPDNILDKERYQTIYAKDKGSVAAPTAGLHFTPEIQTQLQMRGAKITYVTLHVGLGTFQPIKVDNIQDHQMHSEFIQVEPRAINFCREAREKNGRVIAVGTTSVRSLESAYRFAQAGKETKGWTDLYLYPGQEFHAVDGMLTNFHQPKSSLLVMLSAFVGRDLLQKAYKEALEKDYRFLSYGDCMLII